MNFYSYEELETEGKVPTSCCECHNDIEPGTAYWFLSCRHTKKGRKFSTYHTCQECWEARREFCKEVFHPTGLLSDLEELRTKLSYDDAQGWSRITNALACLRMRLRCVGAVPTYSPTPLHGPRCVRGGFVG